MENEWRISGRKVEEEREKEGVKDLDLDLLLYSSR